METIVALACTTMTAACGERSTEPAADSADPGQDDPHGDSAEQPPDHDAIPGLGPEALGPTGLRRLSREELARTLADLVGPLPDGLIDAIPIDTETPFDNDYPTQASSPTLVDGLLALSTGVAEHVLADLDRTEAVLGCTPTGANDEGCLRTFAASLGRRALRRPIANEELDHYATFIDHAVEEGDFDVAATMVFQAILMDVEFLYRIETGEIVGEDPLVLRLDDRSMATRLSYLLWGTTPDDTLLARAEAGELSTPGQVREAAEAMLADQRGLEQLQRFHAMWLDYDDLPRGSSLEAAMHTETDALVERVVAEGAWSKLFTFGESYLDPELAEHYDLGTPVDAPGWVAYPDKRRAGILSHGAFLSVGEKFGDTSPVERGKAIWTRLLCQEIPPPPPDVDSGVPPAGDPDACKLERYDMASRSACASCHAILDPIGFGLENYGPRGQWRTHEPDRPECRIDGAGELPGWGEFAGAPSLGSMLAESSEVRRCAMERWTQFTIGRAVTSHEDPAIDQMARRFEADDDLLAVVLDLVSSEAFMHRVVEQ